MPLSLEASPQLWALQTELMLEKDVLSTLGWEQSWEMLVPELIWVSMDWKIRNLKL